MGSLKCNWSTFRTIVCVCVCVDERAGKYGNMKHVIVVTFIWCLVCVSKILTQTIPNAKAINNCIVYSHTPLSKFDVIVVFVCCVFECSLPCYYDSVSSPLRSSAIFLCFVAFSAAHAAVVIVVPLLTLRFSIYCSCCNLMIRSHMQA